ncbi:U2-type spliceosomal complex subunit CWC15 ASCRUDRAFT_105809 [Ascoidea rubescens DSM 1968]|uniref:Pre-mRNA-splicing factor CWC15 n=1 Tax=Ascoidea rubescens DSM 1968 TaxID=1344418 RepID=A0A1D2VSB5_9ASCO|nr:hypothetical protein ASCRUDRAFT_105809 [Ascoidea rubescens DSM 1968]ODV64503.1 hypothetical protein ASCRUDRAFT_105809 [Ascoidea rubescens DSM 1968]
MTTAHRLTFDPAKGKDTSISSSYASSTQHKRFLSNHTELKYRQSIQKPLLLDELGENKNLSEDVLDNSDNLNHNKTNGDHNSDYIKKRNLLREQLLKNELKHNIKNEYYDKNKRLKLSNKLMITNEPQNNQRASSKVSVGAFQDSKTVDHAETEITNEPEQEQEEEEQDEDSESEEDSDSDSEDETELLLKELQKIKEERRLKKLEREQSSEKESSILSDNSLSLTKNSAPSKKSNYKSWRAESIFQKSNATAKKFKHSRADDDNNHINDILRSKHHQQFLDKHIR